VRPKILIVDDSVDSWNLLSTIVKSHDFYPVWAADGMQAMAAARFHKPQAILLDLGLPDVDGLLILERLKNDHFLRDIPMIVVTIRARQKAEEKARQLGAVAYVSKPVKSDELMASIQTVFAARDGAAAAAAS
jgi:CheY-like chemotaxis protein